MEFQENVIEWLSNDGRNRATLSLSQRRFITQVKRLAEKYPDDVQIVAENEDGSICAHMPVGYIYLKPPRQMSDAQREALDKARAVSDKARREQRTEP